MISGLWSSARARIAAEGSFFGYATSSLLLQVTAIGSAIVIMRHVPPALLGIWQVLVLVHVYGEVINLGISRGLNRELPYALGQGDGARAEALAATAQGHALVTGAIGLSGLLTYVLVCRPPGVWMLGLVCMALIWLASSYRSYLAVTFRSRTEFRRLSRVQFAEAGLQVISLALVVRFGFEGTVVRYALVALVTVWLLHCIRPFRIGPTLRWRDFKLLLGTGLPLYASAYLVTAAMSFEQTILLRRGSVELVGLYAPVSAIVSTMVALRTSMTSYAFPRLVYGMGRGADLARVRRRAFQIMGVSIAASVPLVVVGWFAVPVLIRSVFPAYAPALAACQVALLSGMFIAANATAMSLYALKAWKAIAAYTTAYVALRWFMPNYFVARMEPLQGVVVGGAIATGMLALLGALAVIAATRGPSGNAFPTLAEESGRELGTAAWK